MKQHEHGKLLVVALFLIAFVFAYCIASVALSKTVEAPQYTSPPITVVAPKIIPSATLKGVCHDNC